MFSQIMCWNLALEKLATVIRKYHLHSVWLNIPVTLH